MPKPKLTVGICSGGTIRIETAVSLLSNVYNLWSEGITPNVLAQVGGYVDLNRSIVARDVLESDATHLLFIDNDMIFPDDAIKKLLDADKDIIGASYNVRLDPGSKDISGPTVKMMVDGKPVSMTSQDFPTEPFRCFALGTGFMLIKTGVFKKLTYPYFEAFQDKDGLHHTEDVEFCKRANEAGFEVYCDPTIKMGHVGTTSY